MHADPIVIVSIARTPLGNFSGELKDIPAPELGSYAIKAAIERAHLKPEDIHEVLMGCVLPAGQGQAPARQAALKANIPVSTPCTTLNKVCGSGMKAIMLAHDALIAGSSDIIIAGGMESMTNAPYLLTKARQGYRFGKNEIYDHMTMDGLEDAYDKGRAMGTFAEETVKQYGFSREEQDAYALASFQRARQAAEANLFADEIIPITIHNKQGEKVISKDEHPDSVNLEKLPKLGAAFAKDGTVTAGNASCISDGAAAVILMKESEAKKRGLNPLAKVIAHSSHAKQPSEFTTAPIGAIEQLLKKIGWEVGEIDLWEINEAFAVVCMAAMHDLKISHEKVNIFGGGIALGHPIGASGARIVVTLINALKQKQLKKGIAALCIGGGEATAIAIEMC